MRPGDHRDRAAARGERFSAVDHYFATLRRQYYRRPTDERWGLMAAALRGLGHEVVAHAVVDARGEGHDGRPDDR